MYVCVYMCVCVCVCIYINIHKTELLCCTPETIVTEHWKSTMLQYK